MATLTIFKGSFVNSLRGQVHGNLKKYYCDEAWAGAIGIASQREMLTNIELKGSLDLALPEAGDLKDTENAVRLHKALPQLTPLQARDPRLWVRLAHVEFWEYMRRRWPVERYAADGESKVVGRILERYFVPQSQSRALLRNGAARLWWTAKLSHDLDRDNPYELTHVLLSTLDITQQILERGLGRAPDVVMGFLEFLRRHKSEMLTGGDANRARIRGLAKFLNLHGGVCILDCLNRSQIIALLEQEFARSNAPDQAEEPAETK